MPARQDATSDTDALFQLPLGEFTAARNALATRLKKSGKADAAERVKSLPKPSVSAWAVNQLYWKHRKQFDRLLDVGERFRKAQASQLSGKSADLRSPLEARRETLSTLAHLAADVLKSTGSSATPDMMRRITTTLEALSTYGTSPGAPPAGRLIDDVDPPGFETLAALVPRIGESSREGDEPPRVLPFRQEREARRAKGGAKATGAAEREEEERKAQTAAAKAAVEQAERALRDARKAAERAEANLKKAAARAKDAEKEKAEIEKRLEQATADFNDARHEARRVASQAEQAAQEVEDAERALDKAKKDLEALK